MCESVIVINLNKKYTKNYFVEKNIKTKYIKQKEWVCEAKCDVVESNVIEKKYKRMCGNKERTNQSKFNSSAEHNNKKKGGKY